MEMCWAKAGLHFQGEAERGWAARAAQLKLLMRQELLPALPASGPKSWGNLIPWTQGSGGRWETPAVGVWSLTPAQSMSGMCCRDLPRLWKQEGPSQQGFHAHGIVRLEKSHHSPALPHLPPDHVPKCPTCPRPFYLEYKLGLRQSWASFLCSSWFSRRAQQQNTALRQLLCFLHRVRT